jgi:hypothetical protein
MGSTGSMEPVFNDDKIDQATDTEESLPKKMGLSH